MKTIRFTAFLMLFGLLALVFACKKETNQAAATQTGSKILVTGQDAGNGLKTTLTDFVTSWVITTDQVGIYSPQARNLPGGEGSPIVNAKFLAKSSGVSSTFEGTDNNMYWGAPNTSHNFYAYYPYAGYFGNPPTYGVVVSLNSAQTQSGANNNDHIGALDFMVATPVTVTSPANTNAVGNAVNLRYNHLFTILEFQIKDDNKKWLQAVKLVGTSNPVAFSGGTIDIAQSPPATGIAYTIISPTGTTTEAVVTLTSGATLTPNYTDTKVYLVINPGTQTGNCLIGLYTNDGDGSGTTWKYISKAAPVGGFLRGTKYVVQVDKSSAAPLVDQDGNTFGIVTIGNQTWMAENLKTTKYKDGNSIAWGGGGPNSEIWSQTVVGAYCNYDLAGPNTYQTYGYLYNWYAVNTEKLCPGGWHVPTDDEWTTLSTYLGGEDVAGGYLKEAGTTHWVEGNTATNSTGFTALPGGYCDDSSDPMVSPFHGIGSNGSWWSSTDYWGYAAYYRTMYNASSSVNRYIPSMSSNPDQPQSGQYGYHKYGYSVRCLKNYDAP